MPSIAIKTHKLPQRKNLLVSIKHPSAAADDTKSSAVSGRDNISSAPAGAKIFSLLNRQLVKGRWPMNSEAQVARGRGKGRGNLPSTKFKGKIKSATPLLSSTNVWRIGLFVFGAAVSLCVAGPFTGLSYSLTWDNLINGTVFYLEPKVDEHSDHFKDTYSTTFARLSSECPTLKGQEGRHKKIVASTLESAKQHGVDPDLLLAMIIVESRCKTEARSHVGAMGLMQLMPKTAGWLGVKQPYSVHQNISGGSRYISYLLNRFNNNLPLALAAYNIGPARISPISKKIPAVRETRNYVTSVLVKYRALKESRLKQSRLTEVSNQKSGKQVLLDRV